MTKPLFEQLSLFRFTAPPSDTGGRAHHIQLGAQIVAYQLNRRRRRTIGLTIDDRGLTVGAPHHSGLPEIEALIRSHAAWVVEKLGEYAGRLGRRHLAVRHGARLPVLGCDVEVQVGSGANRAHWGDGVLMLAAKPDADLDALARRALQKRALSLFGERLELYAAKLGRPAPALGLSSARTRWGSCSSVSGIRLNWRLIHLSLDLIDYVVAHELAHLIEMNHSARFWAEVERIYPDWQRARAELKACAADLPVI